MSSLMESKLTPQQHALVKAVLVAQTEALGQVEAPVVENLLKKSRCRKVLDIGCGEGSFLLKLAQRIKGARFLGIDHSELAIQDARGKLRRQPRPNVSFRTAFFDPGHERVKYDAILTRYTLQHCSDPKAFTRAVFDRLLKKGVFVAVESLDDYTDSREPDLVWERFRASVGAIHQRAGSDQNIGKSLGWLFRTVGFREVQVRLVLCSPSTVGWARFRAVVQTSADTAVGLCPDLFDQQLRADVKKWLGNRSELEQKDPYLCTAIASGIKP